MAARGPDSDDAAARRAFLDARRRSSRHRYDTAIAPGYDEAWGAIAPGHGRCIDRLLAMTRAHGIVLDAACGTGKYWPAILASGRTVVGVDQSRGMLQVARRKHPDVPTAVVGLQDLAFDSAFDAVLCIDALENIGPEDWPRVSQVLARAVRPGSPLYVTVELPDADELERVTRDARAQGHPLVAGEDFDGVGYHYFPDRAAVLGWLTAAGLAVVEESEGDGYWHLLLRRTGVPTG